MSLVITILIIVVLIILIVIYIKINEEKDEDIYHKIDKWNNRITHIRDYQNMTYDRNLPYSMQDASTCNLVSAVKLDKLIRTNHDNILTEVNTLINKGYTGFPMKDIDSIQKQIFKNQTGWCPIWVKFIGKEAGTAKHLPTLTNIVRSMGDEILLLHISIFWPPTDLPSHVGISKGVYRYHYGLSIPDNDSNGTTGMIINNTNFKWTQGKGVIWDDTLQHSSWNKTSKPRMVIFADLQRRLPLSLHRDNIEIYRLIQQSKNVKSIQKKLALEGKHID